jgi:hypothetical protein
MEVSVAPAVVDTTTIGVPTTAVGERWSGIARMCLRPLPTLPGLLVLEIVGRRLREILRCVVKKLIHLLVVLGSHLVTSL